MSDAPLWVEREAFALTLIFDIDFEAVTKVPDRCAGVL